jgi:hypothetical protein
MIEQGRLASNAASGNPKEELALIAQGLPYQDAQTLSRAIPEMNQATVGINPKRAVEQWNSYFECAINMNLEGPMPREGIEPSPLAGADFKSAVSAVPPPRRSFDFRDCAYSPSV